MWMQSYFPTSYFVFNKFQDQLFTAGLSLDVDCIDVGAGLVSPLKLKV